MRTQVVSPVALKTRLRERRKGGKVARFQEGTLWMSH